MSSAAPIWDRQLVLVTGKGGVGKTTLAAVLARAAHAHGRRVLVAEVTPDTHAPSVLLAHFGQPNFRHEEPAMLEPRLFGVRISPHIGHRLFLHAALRVRLLVDAAMKSAALLRFLMAAPTFPEIGILYQIVDLLRSKRFDHVVIDLPATGHAVSLASLPRTVNRIVPSGLIGDAIKEGLQTMTDPSRCWAVLPTLPETMPVTETVELAAALQKEGIAIGGAILNAMPADPFEATERKRLEAYVREAAASGSRVQGARELVRLDRALAARQLFYATIPDGVSRFEVPVIDGDDAAVIEGVLAHLDGHRASPMTRVAAAAPAPQDVLDGALPASPGGRTA